MPATTPPIRALGVFCVAAALVSTIQCSDAPTANHQQIQLAHRASLAIAPSFASLPAGAPHIPLSKIRGVLQGAGGDTTVTEALFQGDSAILVFTVSFSGNTGTFTLALTAYDTSGTAVFFTRTSLEVKPGDNPPVAPPPLQYSGPDVAVAKLQITPGAVTMATGGNAGLSVVGLTSTGASLPTAPRVGWTSRNPSLVTVDATGLLTAGALDGQTYVVARTATNVADSVLVTVKATIATFTVTPNPATVAAGDTPVQLTPEVKDAAGHPMTRTVAWSVDHPEIATISAAGKLQGVKRGSATVTATVEDKTVTVPVTVTSAVDHVTMSPASVSFTALGQTQPLTVTVVPHGTAPVAGIPVSVSIDNADVATVAVGSSPGSYVVTAKKVGKATITATADLSSATASVTVAQVAKTLVVSPKTFTSAAQGDTKQFTATVADANGNPLPASAVTWSTDNSGVVTVDNTGLATTVNDGTAHVIATAGALADNATVTVKRVAVRLSITTPKDTIKPGELMIATAAVVDANGKPFPTAITWSSSNTSVLTVGPDGAVTGVALGQAFVQAAGGGMSAGRQVTVSTGGFAVPGTVLIYGPTLDLDTPHNEKAIAEAAGFKVTVADAATWSSMTTADFAKFQAIVFGDLRCSEGTHYFDAAAANKAVWSAAVTGPMILMGNDPVYHATYGNNSEGAFKVIDAGIKYAASGTSTGAYVSLGCYFIGPTQNIDFLGAIGTFQVGYSPSCTPVIEPANASHPFFKEVTLADLSNWGCSVHEAFSSMSAFPSNFKVLAYAQGYYERPSLPYIIAR